MSSTSLFLGLPRRKLLPLGVPLLHEGPVMVEAAFKGKEGSLW